MGWMRANLFSAWYNGAMTVIASIALALALWFGLGWILLEADWTVVATLGGRIIIGQYAGCLGRQHEHGRLGFALFL